jgi:mannosyltransferase
VAATQPQTRIEHRTARTSRWLPGGGGRALSRIARGHAAPALAVLLVALLTRLYQLGAESLWIDEAISYGRATLPPGELLADSVRRKHLPTYFLLLKAVIYIGDSEQMLRLPSVVFGAASAVLAYFIGATLHGRMAGLTAGLLTAVSRLQVHYGQEARMYALLCMATTLAMLGALQLARQPELAALGPRQLWRGLGGEPGDAPALTRADCRRALFAWLAVLAGTTLALYTHNTAPFFVISLNAGALVAVLGSGASRWRFARNWLACMLAVLALWSAWLPTLLQQTGTMRSSWKGRAATTEWAHGVVADVFLLGAERDVLAFMLLGLALCAVYSLRDRKRLLLMCLLFAVAGPLVALAVSQFVPIFYRRLLLWAAPPFFALIGAGIAGLPRLVPALALAAVLLLSQPGLSSYYRDDVKPRWRPMLQKLSAETDERSVILAARSERFLDYYYGRNDDRVPPRAYVHVFSKRRALERYVGDAAEFHVVGQTQERVFKNLRKWIAQTRRYRLVATERHRNAIILKYRLKD